MIDRAPRGAAQNTSKPGDSAVPGAARSREGAINEPERSRTPGGRTMEQDHEGDRLFENPVIAVGRATLNAVGRQAQIITSLGDCSVLTLATLAAVSLLTILHKAPHGRGTDTTQPSHERGTDPASGGEL